MAKYELKLANRVQIMNYTILEAMGNHKESDQVHTAERSICHWWEFTKKQGTAGKLVKTNFQEPGNSLGGSDRT